MRVLVTGSRGMLGGALVPVLLNAGHKVITHGRCGNAQVQADLSDIRQTCALLDQVCPDVIVNLVALANVDMCEEYPQQAYLSNVKTVENLAAWIARNSDCHLVQISTDHVYDRKGPHSEESIELTNCYAFSKYAGELAAVAARATVLRTNFFGPSRCSEKKSFSDWLVEALKLNVPISVFEDVHFSPLSLPTLTRLIEIAVRQKIPGTYNVGSTDGLSKADFAYALAEIFGLSTSGITRASVNSSQLKAYRPRDMRMNTLKFSNVFGLTLPSIRDEIKLIKECYENTNDS